MISICLPCFFRAPEATPKAAEQAEANATESTEPTEGEKKEAAVVDAEENSGPVAAPAAVEGLKEEEKVVDENVDTKAEPEVKKDEA